MAKQNNTPAEAPQVENGADDSALSYGPTAARVFELKKGTEVEAQYDGLKIPFVVAGYGRTPEEQWQNILARTGGDHIAAADIFNSAFALALQKAVKGKTAVVVTKDKDGKETRTEPTATEAELVALADSYTGQRNQRKGGGEQVRKVEKAKASLLDQLLAGEITEDEVRRRMGLGES